MSSTQPENKASPITEDDPTLERRRQASQIPQGQWDNARVVAPNETAEENLIELDDKPQGRNRTPEHDLLERNTAVENDAFDPSQPRPPFNLTEFLQKFDQLIDNHKEVHRQLLCVSGLHNHLLALEQKSCDRAKTILHALIISNDNSKKQVSGLEIRTADVKRKGDNLYMEIDNILK